MKSWSVARALLLAGTQHPERILCCREYQNSIAASSHKLLSDQISEMGLSGWYDVTQNSIVGKNGTEFLFVGLHSNLESIKSIEGVTIAWIEEAQTISEASYQILLPTIRAKHSSIWITFNPKSADDPTHKRFCVDTPDNCVLITLNWRDNPYFSPALEEERRRDQERLSDEEYRWIWEGELLTISDACIFRGKFEVREFETPKDATFYLGADFGFARDPSTLVRCFIEDETLYIDHEAYEVGVETDHLPAFYDRVPGSRRWTIRADSARPDTISYLARQGFRIVGAEKGPNSIEEGIRHLKSYKCIVIHPRCVHTAEEFRKYSYKIDKRTEEVLPVIAGGWDHTIDALRYAVSKVRAAKSTSLATWAKLAS
jgi:phage terminase large subunit